MKPLRKLLDNLKPNFTNGGALEKYFPLYDVFENLFYSSGHYRNGILQTPHQAGYMTSIVRGDLDEEIPEFSPSRYNL